MSGQIMTDEIETGDAEPVENTVDNTNISVTDFANRRLGELNSRNESSESELTENAHEQESEEEVEEEVEETEEVAETESEEESEESQESEDVLSQLDLDEMSEEDLRELSEKLGSRAVARFGELTAKRKAAEAQIKQLEAKLQEKPDPLKTRKVENNPYSKLDSIEALQDKAEEVDGVVEWAEDLLFESDGFSAEDVVTEIEGKEWTKKDVRQALLKARKAQKTFLPDQLSKVQAQIEGEQLAGSFGERAKKELDWLDGEDNDLRKQYEAIVGDDRMKQIKKVFKREAPELGAQLDYWFAHATNSIYGRKPVETNKKVAPSLNPPKTGNPSAAQSEKSMGRTAKALKELEARFKSTGSANDFAALRKLKMASRR
jgi:nicotinamide mononucleotide adenylyltransferase